jgi:hypothetical protein
MGNENKKVKEKFDVLFAEWEKAIQDPKIQLSSRPQDYINNEPYREIVKLGRDALPFIIEKLEQGVFFLNQAVVEITGIKMEEIIGKELRFPSEQEKSTLLVKWWRSQEQ